MGDQIDVTKTIKIINESLPSYSFDHIYLNKFIEIEVLSLVALPNGFFVIFLAKQYAHIVNITF